LINLKKYNELLKNNKKPFYETNLLSKISWFYFPMLLISLSFLFFGYINFATYLSFFFMAFFINIKDSISGNLNKHNYLKNYLWITIRDSLIPTTLIYYSLSWASNNILFFDGFMLFNENKIEEAFYYLLILNIASLFMYFSFIFNSKFWKNRDDCAFDDNKEIKEITKNIVFNNKFLSDYEYYESLSEKEDLYHAKREIVNLKNRFINNSKYKDINDIRIEERKQQNNINKNEDNIEIENY